MNASNNDLADPAAPSETSRPTPDEQLFRLDDGPGLDRGRLADDPPFGFDGDDEASGFGTCSAATDSTAAVAIGATTLPVLSSTGFAAADAIVVEPGANEETRVVQSVAAGQIVVTVPLSRAHAAGVEIRNSPNTGGRLVSVE